VRIPELSKLIPLIVVKDEEAMGVLRAGTRTEICPKARQ
jgi:hypothetical protein